MNTTRLFADGLLFPQVLAPLVTEWPETTLAHIIELEDLDRTD